MCTVTCGMVGYHVEYRQVAVYVIEGMNLDSALSFMFPVHQNVLRQKFIIEESNAYKSLWGNSPDRSALSEHARRTMRSENS